MEHTTNQKSDAMHKKRSQSFLAHPGHISSDEKSEDILSNGRDGNGLRHLNSHQKDYSYTRHSRRHQIEDPNKKYAEDFHKNKRHTYHFPEINVDLMNEDLTFTEPLSRENVSNGNLNHIGNTLYNQISMQNQIQSNRTARQKEYTRNETIHNSHHRSRSSPPSEDIYGRQIKRASRKTDNRNQYIYGSRNQNSENNNAIFNPLQFKLLGRGYPCKKFWNARPMGKYWRICWNGFGNFDCSIDWYG